MLDLTLTNVSLMLMASAGAGLVDAIVDITETGSSIKANKLRIVDTLMTSYPQFIANRETMQDEWKKQKLERLVKIGRAHV